MVPTHGGILSGPEIESVVARTARLRADRAAGLDVCRVLPEITITPFDPRLCGPNSYDVHLSDRLRVYDRVVPTTPGFPPTVYELPPTYDYPLDMRADNPTREIRIPESGLVLVPGTLYLGSTVERTVTSGLTPWLDGRSSVGRLGIHIHVTAGRGDDAFGEASETDGGSSWTMEIHVVHPVRVYAGVKIGQLSYFTLVGERRPYAGRYQNQGADPVASRFHLPDGV